jgi:hypothetical protein
MSARFGREIEFTGVDLPGQVRPGETVEVRYHWRALSRLSDDYWAFVHLQGPGYALIHDHVIGRPTFGTSHWVAGEEASVTVPLVVPPDAEPGPYRIRLGVWLPDTGKRLRVTETDLPHAPHSVEIGVMTVVARDPTVRVGRLSH